jgi:tellurite resistance protein
MPATKTIDHQAALIYVMVTMAAVDRTMTDKELARIGQTISTLPVFETFDTNLLVATAEDCGKLLSSPDGLEQTLGLVARSVPVSLRETAYALALEVAAADDVVGQEELRFLELLAERFELSKLIIAALERGARARYRLAP